jgi:HlyD family secretion protein
MQFGHLKRRVFVLLALMAAGAGGAWWWITNSPADGPLVLQGNVEIRQVNLAFKVAGRIASLAVDEGATVAAGQKIASLEKVYFEDSRRQAQAQHDQAAANFAKMMAGNRPEEIAQSEANVHYRRALLLNAQQARQRAEALLKTASGTQKTYDDAIAGERQAEAQLNSARQALQLMNAGFRQEDIEAARGQLAEKDAAFLVTERQLSDADLIAPSAGVVLSRVREVGAIVNAGETVFVLSLNSPVWVRTYVSEPDLGRIRPNMEVELRSDTPGANPIKGRVGFISATAEFTPKTVETRELRTALVYRVRIVADDPEGMLRQGMPMTVTAATPLGAVQVTAGPR